jgi:hypothetical protein
MPTGARAMPTGDPAPLPDAEVLSLHYRELARLADRCDAMTRSAFDDIKLLGGLAALLGWPWLADSVTALKGAGAPYLLLGFLLILAALAVIGYASLLRQSVVLFYMRAIRQHELEIRRLLGDAAGGGFEVAGRWPGWSAGVQRPLARWFYGLFYLAVLGFPTAVLKSLGERSQAALYLSAALLVALAHWCSTDRLHARNSDW